MDSLRGQILVAAPSLLDPNFRRATVLVSEHGDEGAMGVVLNRPSESTIGDALPQLAALLEPSELVYVGGPVRPTSIVFLAEFLDTSCAALLAFDCVGVPRADTGVEELVRMTERRRVFAGYAGWGAGQLEGEIESGDWIAAPAIAGDVFSDRPHELWSAVLTRKGGPFALLATMPPDPSRN